LWHSLGALWFAAMLVAAAEKMSREPDHPVADEYV
jgi:hypothetical protein